VRVDLQVSPASNTLRTKQSAILFITIFRRRRFRVLLGAPCPAQRPEFARKLARSKPRGAIWGGFNCAAPRKLFERVEAGVAPSRKISRARRFWVIYAHRTRDQCGSDSNGGPLNPQIFQPFWLANHRIISESGREREYRVRASRDHVLSLWMENFTSKWSAGRFSIVEAVDP